MTDNRTYPRFGGDRKLTTLTTMPLCECCPEEKDIRATHVVNVQFDWFRGNDEIFNVCPYHVGQARRFHTFKKFLAGYKGRD